MVEDQIKLQWNQLAGRLMTKWSKLTSNDLKVGEGSSEYLIGRIRERYGLAQEEAHRQVEDFGRGL
jgi:uncharacterized protein YjbJ (UPF0337 family)